MKTPSIQHRFVMAVPAIVVWLGLASLSAQAWNTNFIRAGVDIPATISNGLPVTHSDVLTRGPNAQGHFSRLGAFPWAGRTAIDALMVISNRLVVSFDCTFREAGVTYADEDLVAYDPTTSMVSMFFDGSTRLPAAIDLDAVARYDSDAAFLFSVDAPANISGVGWVESTDVLRYGGATLALLFHGANQLGIPQRCNLDALHYENGNVYFSLDTDAAINGARGRDKDVWMYNPVAGTTTLATANFFMPPAADLTALDYPTDTDADWLSDFEEASGNDEVATTIPGSSTALTPNHNLSLPDIPDSDDDGMSDGTEAASGTNPTNSQDYLHLVAVNRSVNSTVISWASVPGKTYALYIGTRPDVYDYALFDDVIAESDKIVVTNTTPGALDCYRLQLRY